MEARSVEELVARLASPLAEQAWHNLVELGPSVVPQLCASFQYCRLAEARAAIVEVVAQHRRAEDAEFLLSALSDPAEQVWQAAIDGLVSLHPAVVLPAVRAALANELAANSERSRKATFLAEAVSELENSRPYGLGEPPSAPG